MLVSTKQSQITVIPMITNLICFHFNSLPNFIYYHQDNQHSLLRTIINLIILLKIKEALIHRPIHTTDQANRSTLLFFIAFIRLFNLKICSKLYRTTLEYLLKTFYKK